MVLGRAALKVYFIVIGLSHLWVPTGKINCTVDDELLGTGDPAEGATSYVE